MIQVLVFTDGRDCIYDALPSFRRHLKSDQVMKWLVIDDSADAMNKARIEEAFPWVEVSSTKKRLGFSGTIQRGWSEADFEADWIFHLEDDFVLNEDLNVDPMIRVLEYNPDLAQIVLKRQPWSPEEKTAGGIVEMWPDLYEEKERGGFAWTEHELFFSTNPSVYNNAISHLGWPDAPRSEEKFTKKLLAAGMKFAFWGGKFDDPLVEHIGDERVGTGY